MAEGTNLATIFPQGKHYGSMLFIIQWFIDREHAQEERKIKNNKN
jgi:hypothetical protein